MTSRISSVAGFIADVTASAAADAILMSLCPPAGTAVTVMRHVGVHAISAAVGSSTGKSIRDQVEETVETIRSMKQS